MRKRLKAHLELRMLLVTGSLISGGALLGASSVAAADDWPPVAAEPVLEYAAQQMNELTQYEGTIRSRQVLLRRNLGRYFFAYEIPSERGEVDRLLGAFERVWRRLASEFLGQVADRAANDGRIDLDDIEAVRRELLPSRPVAGRFPEARLEFFPDDPRRRIVVETVDLEALRDTGLLWLVVAQVVEEARASNPRARPSSGTSGDVDVPSSRTLTWAPEAVPAFSRAVLAYGLVSLRMAADFARAEYAPAVGPPHLRQAQRLLAGREDADPLPAWPVEELPTGEPWFVDVTTAAGVDFEHFTSDWLSRARRYRPVAPTFSGGGATTVDLDGDGLDDLVVCGGAGCRLWRNASEGVGEVRFAEQPDAGVTIDGEARMAVAADFDNDGRRDLFLTYARDSNRLLHNQSPASADGELRFVDVTQQAGIERAGDVSGPAVAFDYDDDGRLDLYVGNFGNYLEGASPWVTGDRQRALPNRLYRNVTEPGGPLRFEDVSERAGIGDQGWAQALSHADLDGDGDQDLYVANDFGENALLLNRGDGTFESVAAETGSLDANHGMNVAFADLNRDRRPEVLITNIWAWDAAKKETFETNTLLISQPGDDQRPYFTASRAPAIVEHDAGWGWAALFFDVQNDGLLDLAVLNGFTDYFTFSQQRESPLDPQQLYPLNNARDANILFLGDEGSADGVPSRLARGGFELPEQNSRSLALADFDRDGALDLAVTAFHERARVFRSRALEKAAQAQHWLGIDLVGDVERGVNRDAIGAVVVATSSADPDFYAWRAVQGGEGYLGMSSLRVHLGLGALEAVDLEVIWPGGERETFAQIPTDRIVRIEQGKTAALLESGASVDIVWADQR